MYSSPFAKARVLTFDGDEMNAHIPQSYESMVELEEIAAVPHHIITPRHAKPMIGIYQDTLVGSYLLTKPGIQFTRREFMNLMMWNKRFDGIMPLGRVMLGDQERWSGQQVLGALLPPINMELGNKSYDSENPNPDNYVKIKQGDIQQGTVDGDIYMKPSKGIVHITYNDYGAKDTVDLLDSLQSTVEGFLVLNGFSVGISDLIADDETKKQIDAKIQERKKQVEQFILQVHLDLFDNNTGKTNQQEFEDQIFGILNQATSDAGSLGQKSLSTENRLLAMVRSGSKGEPLNVAQMMACLGQTAIEGKRVPYGFTDRTLPHYKKYDDSSEARGFIESSFIRGLTPQQFFFHAMSGREGLIDTAVKSVTADTEIVIQENGQTKWTTIGSWIDGHIDSAKPEEVEHHKEANMELLQLKHEVYIPTCNEKGQVTWGQLTAVTRHDPGECLYTVKTKGGRQATVAKSQSLLVWNDEQKEFLEKPSPDVKVGEYVPALYHIPDQPVSYDLTILNMIRDRAANVMDAEIIHDVVKDEIISIEPISVEGHPKLYDVTVPSTLNFAIANGLVCRDTADTGYIQRQLIKSMEDLTVQHDGSVRDANNNIVQYHYGEDGTNPVKIETQTLSVGKLSESDIAIKYGMQGVDWSTILKDGVAREDDSAMITIYTETLKQDRTMMVEGVFQKKSLDSGSVFAPVNLARYILNIKVRFALNPKDKTDLTPAMVLTGINDIIKRTHTYHIIWAALLRFHLAPHKLIVEERFTKAAFDMLKELILINHMKSWVQPGDQVGIVAAQSIGEPATQMSCEKDSLIVLQNDKNLKYFGTVGEFCDAVLEKNAEKVITIGNDSVVLPLEENYFIVGVSEDEKTSWRRISEISRHPANGGMVEVVTRTGRKTTATLTHSFLKRSTTGIVPVLGSDLKVGMRIPIARHVPEVPHPIMSVVQGITTFEMNKEFGWVCGMYLADGKFNGNTVVITKISPVVEEKLIPFSQLYNIKFSTHYKDGQYGPGKDNMLYSKDLKDFLMATFNTGSYDKQIGATVFHSNKEFIAGVISGFFDGDGNVSVERQLIRASSRSKKLIEHITMLLGYVGLFGCMSKETSVRMKDDIQYTLVIPRKFAFDYKDKIGFNLPEKVTALDEIIQYNNRPDAHSVQEMIDKIPELGQTIAETGRLLKMPGQSRMYGRWAKKDAIGRQTLEKYVAEFEAKITELTDEVEKIPIQVEQNMMILRSAVDADVVWDEIVELIYHEDPKEYVYDFTVPGNDSFMVDCNVLVHNTLNTFHQAGVASKSAVTRGVPRLRELLKVTQNPKATSLTIYLKPEYRDNKDRAREVVQDLELTLLSNITNKVGIYWDKKDATTIIPEDRELMKFYSLFEAQEEKEDKQSKWVLRLELNREEMFNRNISIQEVVSVIKRQFEDIKIVYSDYNSDKLVMRIRLPNKNEKSEKDTASRNDDLTNLKKFQNKLLNSIVIRGVPGIKDVTFRKDKQYVEIVDGKYEQVEQFVLDTNGSNFIKVMNHPMVDGTKVYSTNVWDIYEVLGIEATRATLFNEINGLFDSVGVNYRHLCLLCDVMTRSGHLMSIDRYGINKNDIGTLAKASFEETEKILLKAALFGEVDPVTGVSANIMMGQPIRGGTAFSQIMLDDQMMIELMKTVDVEANKLQEETDVDLDDLYTDSTAVFDPCSKNQFQSSMILPSVKASMAEPDIEFELVDE